MAGKGAGKATPQDWEKGLKPELVAAAY